MVIIDYAHLAFKSLYVTLGKESYSKSKVDFKKYKGMFIHLVFNYLKLAQCEFAKGYGNEIVLALEGAHSWRKSYYPKYKANRTLNENLDWENEVFPAINEIADIVKTTLPYKVLRVTNAEGDDVIATLAKHTKEPVLIISEDKDFKQLLKYSHVTLYRPIKKEFLHNIPSEEIKKDITKHILLGDKVDNIPSILEETMFNNDFIKFLNEHNIFETDVCKFQKLEIAQQMFDLFGENPYKPAYFGEKSAEVFMENLEYNLEHNELAGKNYNRNKTLISFDKIPENLELAILEEYNNSKPVSDPNTLLQYFLKNNCKKHADDIGSFCSNNLGVTAFDDWF